MKIKLITLTMALAGLFLWGCDEPEELTTATVSSTSEANTVVTCCPYPEKIDFNQYAAGTIPSEVHAASGAGPIGVYGINPQFPSQNAAMIFDSSNPTGGDSDLKTPGYANSADLKKVLIVSEDLNTNEPNDTDRNGAILKFDFSKIGPVLICSLDIIDLETRENESGKVIFYGKDGKISESALPTPGDNAVATANFGVAGVLQMEIILNGSSAIDNIKFCVKKEEPPADRGCTRTQGYWKNHSKYGPAPYDATWAKLGEDNIFYYSLLTNYLEINTPSAGGNAYHILARQFIAARLNMLAGASAPDEVEDAMADAHDLFNDPDNTPITIGLLRGSDPLRKEFLRLAEILDDYNNGRIGPGHCDEEDQEK
jgi:hypothetical protein